MVNPLCTTERPGMCELIGSASLSLHKQQAEERLHSGQGLMDIIQETVGGSPNGLDPLACLKNKGH